MIKDLFLDFVKYSPLLKSTRSWHPCLTSLKEWIMPGMGPTMEQAPLEVKRKLRGRAMPMLEKIIQSLGIEEWSEAAD
jgi:hypothetical protein